MTYAATINRLQTAALNKDSEEGREVVRKATGNQLFYYADKVYYKARIGASRGALNMLLHHVRRSEETRIDNVIRDFFPKLTS